MLHRLRAGAAVCCVVGGVFVANAFAHAPSFSCVSVDLNSATGAIAVAVHLTPWDRDSDGQISAAEYATAREFIHANSSQWLALKQGSTALSLAPGEFVESFAEKSLSWTTVTQILAAPATTAAPSPNSLTSLGIPVISRLGEGHRAYVEVRRNGKLLVDALLSRNESTLVLPVVLEKAAAGIVRPLASASAKASADEGARGSEAQQSSDLAAPSAPISGSTPSDGSAAPSAPSSSRAAGFFKLGIEHILTGYDHLLFLAGLILVCRKFRDFLGVVTSFTVAHSITLGLSALGGVQVPSALIEPLIAASIVLVGIENVVLRGAAPKRRWMPAFVFGLIHGFGFAGALRDAGFGSGLASWISLGSFNLGVEAGQLALVALALPALLWLRKQPRIEVPFVQLSSAAVIACGTFWFAQRIGI